MKKKATTTFVIGARPPQALSPKAAKQLSSAKPSKKAQALAENAARVLGNGNTQHENSASAPEYLPENQRR